MVLRINEYFSCLSFTSSSSIVEFVQESSIQAVFGNYEY